jgi:hypothetical protein
LSSLGIVTPAPSARPGERSEHWIPDARFREHDEKLGSKMFILATSCSEKFPWGNDDPSFIHCNPPSSQVREGALHMRRRD